MCVCVSITRQVLDHLRQIPLPACGRKKPLIFSCPSAPRYTIVYWYTPGTLSTSSEGEKKEKMTPKEKDSPLFAACGRKNL